MNAAANESVATCFSRCARLVCATLFLLSSTAPANGDDTIELRIRERIAANPHKASNWRLLGRVYLQQADLSAAEQALRQAISLDASSSATQLDMGRVLVEAKRPQEAVLHLQKSAELAPESDHAIEALELLQQLQNDPNYATLVRFDTSWLDRPRSNDSSLSEIEEVTPNKRFDLSLEAGLMFNSNVELAPISRQLSNSELSSFQAYAVPEARYVLIDKVDWQLGTSLDTYFNVNETHLEAFNLQHYEPGFYFDRAMLWGTSELATRVGYNYSYDLFGGKTFGDRHLLTTSLVAFHKQPVKSIVYWALGYTDFRNDGDVPAIDSADGMTNTIGFSRSWEIEGRRITQFDLGADVQWADLQGADMSYQGVFLYSEAKVPFIRDSVLTPTAGWGYRHFPDFTGSPTRDENLISTGITLEKQISEQRILTLFFNYDRFDSPNPGFKSDRYTTGIFATFRR